MSDRTGARFLAGFSTGSGEWTEGWTERMAKLFWADGVELEIKSENAGGRFTVEELRHLIGLNLQLVLLSVERIMVMNAYASQTRLPPNRKATRLCLGPLARRKSPASKMEIIRGDVLVAAKHELHIEQILASGVPVL
jgi:hypothetical protein